MGFIILKQFSSSAKYILQKYTQRKIKDAYNRGVICFEEVTVSEESTAYGNKIPFLRLLSLIPL